MAQFSDVDGSAGKLADIVTCSVCLDPFTAPKTLQCHHSFCKQCLAKILHAKLVKEGVLVSTKETVLEIECPNCKAKHGGVDTISAIKTNPNVNQMLAFYDEFTVKKQLGNEGKLCPCKEVAKYSCLRYVFEGGVQGTEIFVNMFVCSRGCSSLRPRSGGLRLVYSREPRGSDNREGGK